MTQNLFQTQSEDEGQLSYYEGMMKKLPPLMVGKLFVTARYVGFHAYEVRSAGVLGKSQLAPSGKVLGIAMDKIVDVAVEGGIRAKRSKPNWRDAADFERKASGEKPINTKPKPLDGPEKFKRLMITCESDSGLEVAVFEAHDPEGLSDKIRGHRAKSGL